jgi:hypothetical protein
MPTDRVQVSTVHRRCVAAVALCSYRASHTNRRASTVLHHSRRMQYICRAHHHSSLPFSSHFVVSPPVQRHHSGRWSHWAAPRRMSGSASASPRHRVCRRRSAVRRLHWRVCVCRAAHPARDSPCGLCRHRCCHTHATDHLQGPRHTMPMPPLLHHSYCGTTTLCSSA